jgi:hypothetical protein
MKTHLKYLMQVFILLVTSCNSATVKENKNGDSSKYQNSQLDTENQVIWAVLQREYRRTTADTIYDKNKKIIQIFKHDMPPKPHLLIINETIGILYNTSDSTFRSLKERGLTLLTPKLLNDLCLRNESSIKIGPFNGFDGDITYASLAEEEQMTSRDIDKKPVGPLQDEPEKEFFILKKTDREHVYFSRPGFNENRTLAIIEYSTYSDPLCSAQLLFIVGKINGQWKVLESIITVMS